MRKPIATACLSAGSEVAEPEPQQALGLMFGVEGFGMVRVEPFPMEADLPWLPFEPIIRLGWRM